MKAFLADPKSEKSVVAKLAQAWVARKEIVAKQEARDKLAKNGGESANATGGDAAELFRAIEKNKSADALRAES